MGGRTKKSLEIAKRLKILQGLGIIIMAAAGTYFFSLDLTSFAMLLFSKTHLSNMPKIQN